MISTTQSTTYNLTLTAEQFDDLYELLDDTIGTDKWSNRGYRFDSKWLWTIPYMETV